MTHVYFNVFINGTWIRYVDRLRFIKAIYYSIKIGKKS